MESSSSRSARVKLQLRDKKGRWIEMGSKLKWIGSDGKNWYGKAVGQTGQNVNIEVDGKTGTDGGKKVMLVNRKKVQVIEEKASLDPNKPATDAPAAPETPQEPAEAVAPSKFKNTPTPTTYVMALQKAEDGPLLTPLSEIQVGDKLYPIVSGPKPYGMATSTSSAAVQKFGAGLGTVTSIKEGKYAVVEGSDGKKYFPSLKHNGFKATPESDAALVKAMEDEKAAMGDAGISDKAGPAWIEALKNPEGAAKAELPETAPAEEPAPVPEAPAAEVPEAEPAAAEPDVTVKAAPPHYLPDAVMVESADGETPLVTPIKKLKVGDKIYPVSNILNAPYGSPVNHNSKHIPVYTENKAGVGEVESISDNYIVVKGADGKTYTPSKSHNALKTSPNIDAKISEFKAASDAAKAPEAEADTDADESFEVTSNNEFSKGSVKIEKKDGSNVVQGVGTLKVGDKVYPGSGTDKQPYAQPGAVKKTVFVKTDHPAGVGTVKSVGGNNVSVEGEDGKTYEVSKFQSAVKATKELDTKIAQVKATFGAPADAPGDTPTQVPIATKVEIVDDTFVYTSAKPLDISKWSKVNGTQMGSNPGGIYKDESGKEWYVKHPQSNDHALNEVLADDLYKAAGIPTSNLQLADLGNGKLGTASPMLEGVQKNLKAKLKDAEYKQAIQDGFAMDVLLANWDVAGLTFDNIVTDKDGKPVRVDPGGALIYRAQGSPKGNAFGGTAGEWETLRNGSNAQSAALFGDMTDEQLANSAKKVEALTPEKINEIVDASGFSDAIKTSLKTKLAARREDILAKAPKAAAAPEPAADPAPEATPDAAPEVPAAPEPTPDTAPEPAPVPPSAEPVEEPAAPAPAQPEAPAEAPAPQDDPFAGIELKDKGKTTLDSNGDTIKVGTIVTHKNGKNGKGIIIQVLPSTDSAKIIFENGVQQTALGKVLTTSTEQVSVEPQVPATLSPGEVFFDTVTGKTHLGSKDGVPLSVGDKVSYTKKGVTQEGTVKGFYPGQQTVSVNFDDGTTSTKKASVLQKLSVPAEQAPAAPETPADEPTPEVVPDETPAPEAAPEAPAAPEEAPAEPESLDGKENPTKEDLNALPVGAKLISANYKNYVKTEDGKWAPEEGNHGPYSTNMMADGDGVAYGFKVELNPASAPEAAPADVPAADALEEIGAIVDPSLGDLNAAPVGAQIKNNAYNHYWVKNEEGKWDAYYPDGKPMDITVSTGDLLTVGTNKANDHTLVLSPEAPATEATPDESPADVPATPDYLALQDAKLDTLTDEQFNGLPLGTKLVSTVYDHFWKKTEPSDGDDYQAFNKSTGTMIDVSTKGEDIFASTFNKDTHTLDFGDVEKPAASEAPAVPAVETTTPKDGDDAKALSPDALESLPAGTKIVGDNDQHLKKKADGKWGAHVTSWGDGTPAYQTLDNDAVTEHLADMPEATYKLELPQEAAPAEAAPEAEADDLSALEGKLASDLTPEQIKALPEGSKFVANYADHYWVKDGGNGLQLNKPWSAYDKATDKKLGVSMEDEKFWTNDAIASGHNLELPKAEEQAAPAAEEAPAGPKVIPTGTGTIEDYQNAPVGSKAYFDYDKENYWEKVDSDVWHKVNTDGEFPQPSKNFVDNDGKAVTTLDLAPETPGLPEDVEAADEPTTLVNPTYEDFVKLPVGSKAYFNDAHKDKIFWVKKADNHWQYKDDPSQGVSLDDGFKDNKGETGGVKVDLPASASAPATKASDLPVGTFVPARTGSTVGFKKLGENEWTMTVFDKPVGEKLTDSFVQSVADQTQPEVTVPDAPSGAPEADTAPADAPETISETDNTKSVTGDFKDNPYTAEDFLPGSKLTAPSGNVYIKNIHDQWHKSGSSTKLDNGDVNGIKMANWKIDGIVVDAAAAPAVPGVSMPWAGSAPDAKWIADGSKISMGTTVYTKIDADTWESETGYKVGSDIINNIKDSGWTLTLPGDADSNAAPAAAPAPTGPQLWSDMPQTASELPVGSKVSSSSMSATKTSPNEWSNDSSDYKYSDSQVDAVKGSTTTTWKMELPSNAATPAAAPAVQKEPVELNTTKVFDLPVGTVVTNTAEDYSLKLTNSNQWKPIDKDGKFYSFKDGDSYAAYYELYDGNHFETNSWLIFEPGEDWQAKPDASATPVNPHIPADFVGTKHSGMTMQELKALPNGAFVVSDNGYVMKKTGLIKFTPVSEESFKDGTSWAGTDELAKGSTHFPAGDWTVYTPASPEAAASVPDAKEMTFGDLQNLPADTILKDVVSGATFKKMTPPGWGSQSLKWVPIDANGNPTTFDDGAAYADSAEISNSSSTYDKYKAAKWVVNPTATTTTTPQGVPTGPVGSATNPAKVTGVLPTTELLDSYPTGTTLKKEGNFTSIYHFVKLADGKWEYKKNSSASGSKYSSAAVPDTFFKNGTTATVHQPKPYGKHAVLGTGEIVYAGDSVYYKGEVGYIASITDAGKISVQVNGKKGYKAASTLSHDLNYGKKGATATATPTATPSAPAAPTGPVAPTVQNFAGADANQYNAEGATFKGIPVAPKSGLSVASAGPVDTTNPLYGADKPLVPEEPNTGKWDSAAWLKAVEDRYVANPNKQKSKVQDSNNWNTIENVLNGQAGSLDKLLSNKYIDQKMYDDAKAGIAAHEASIKSVVDAHKVKMSEYQTALEAWQAANPTDSQYKDAAMPEVSTTPFTGGEADWSKAPVGTYTVESALAAIKKDVAAANRGASVATDSSDIEDLAVKFKRRLDLTGTEVIEANFKVTPVFATSLFDKLKGMGASQSGQIWLPKFKKDENSGLLKDISPNYSDSMSYASGKRQVWTDSETGAKVIFQRTSDPDSNNTHTLNNSVRILMPKDSGSAEYQKVLEKLGIVAKPSTAGDIKVFAENKFITVFKGKGLHEYKKNLTGAQRTKALQDIKAEYGLSPDDLYFGVDGNGDTKLFFTDEAAEKLQQKTKVDGFYHNLSDSSADSVFAMITGSNPGLNSTYQRWSNGIHKSGMSSSSDIGYGSGDFMYTKVSHNSSGKAQNSGTVFINPKAALKRLDIYGNSGDNFGKKSTSSPSPYELMKGNPYEIMFKHTVPLSEWSHVTLSASERTKLIERLKEHGITKINGIPLENFILTSGMSIPQIDPSVYSASATNV